jgi:hypothetical protein
MPSACAIQMRVDAQMFGSEHCVGTVQSKSESIFDEQHHAREPLLQRDDLPLARRQRPSSEVGSRLVGELAHGMRAC